MSVNHRPTNNHKPPNNRGGPPTPPRRNASMPAPENPNDWNGFYYRQEVHPQHDQQWSQPHMHYHLQSYQFVPDHVPPHMPHIAHMPNNHNQQQHGQNPEIPYGQHLCQLYGPQEMPPERQHGRKSHRNHQVRLNQQVHPPQHPLQQQQHQQPYQQGHPPMQQHQHMQHQQHQQQQYQQYLWEQQQQQQQQFHPTQYAYQNHQGNPPQHQMIHHHQLQQQQHHHQQMIQPHQLHQNVQYQHHLHQEHQNLHHRYRKVEQKKEERQKLRQEHQTLMLEGHQLHQVAHHHQEQLLQQQEQQQQQMNKLNQQQQQQYQEFQQPTMVLSDQQVQQHHHQPHVMLAPAQILVPSQHLPVLQTAPVMIQDFAGQPLFMFTEQKPHQQPTHAIGQPNPPQHEQEQKSEQPLQQPPQQHPIPTTPPGQISADDCQTPTSESNTTDSSTPSSRSGRSTGPLEPPREYKDTDFFLLEENVISTPLGNYTIKEIPNETCYKIYDPLGHYVATSAESPVEVVRNLVLIRNKFLEDMFKKEIVRENGELREQVDELTLQNAELVVGKSHCEDLLELTGIPILKTDEKVVKAAQTVVNQGIVKKAAVAERARREQEARQLKQREKAERKARIQEQKRLQAEQVRQRNKELEAQRLAEENFLKEQAAELEKRMAADKKKKANALKKAQKAAQKAAKKSANDKKNAQSEYDFVEDSRRYADDYFASFASNLDAPRLATPASLATTPTVPTEPLVQSTSEPDVESICSSEVPAGFDKVEVDTEEDTEEDDSEEEESDEDDYDDYYLEDDLETIETQEARAVSPDRCIGPVKLFNYDYDRKHK